MNSLKENFQNNSVIYISGLMITAFISGVGAEQWRSSKKTHCPEHITFNSNADTNIARELGRKETELDFCRKELDKLTPINSMPPQCVDILFSNLKSEDFKDYKNDFILKISNSSE